jgi:outer membrane lipoprotein SlyB
MQRILLGAALLASVATLTQPASAQNDALGGAILGGVVGGVIGGAATGRAGGAIVGAVVGGAAGAAIGSEAERRRGYYWYRGGCYRRVQGGYVQVSPRYC